jgi:hypothetical protein
VLSAHSYGVGTGVSGLKKKLKGKTRLQAGRRRHYRRRGDQLDPMRAKDEQVIAGRLKYDMGIRVVRFSGEQCGQH